MGISGRLALFLAIVLTVWSLFHVYAFQQAARGPRVVRHEVKVSSLPGGRPELKLVQLSDLHVGTLLGEKRLGQRPPMRLFFRSEIVEIILRT